MCGVLRELIKPSEVYASEGFVLWGWCWKIKKPRHFGSIKAFVGVTRFELATTRPPDAYSNRAELHPERCIEFRVTLSIRDANIELFF